MPGNALPAKMSREIEARGVYARSQMTQEDEKGSNFSFSSINPIGRRQLAVLLPLRPVSIRIFIGRSHCIAQNADKSHYPETTGAVERAAYLAPLKSLV